MASGANKRSVPRFVFVPTTALVARTAVRTVTPTEHSAACCMAGLIATALSRKSFSVSPGKSAPGWTFPGLGAVTSSMQASVAHCPIVKVLDIETINAEANCRIKNPKSEYLSTNPKYKIRMLQKERSRSLLHDRAETASSGSFVINASVIRICFGFRSSDFGFR